MRMFQLVSFTVIISQTSVICIYADDGSFLQNLEEISTGRLVVLELVKLLSTTTDKYLA